MSIDKKPSIDKYLKQRIEEKVVFKEAVSGLKDILLSQEIEEEL
jgi:flagellar biosynthesis/type III secretory pathway ATPase